MTFSRGVLFGLLGCCVVMSGCSKGMLSGTETAGVNSNTGETLQIGVSGSMVNCKQYALSEYNTPLLSWMNSISTSQSAKLEQQVSFSGAIQLQGFTFAAQQTQYFSVDVPLSGTVDGYTLSRSYDTGSNSRSLRGVVPGDSWEMLRFEVQEGNYDITGKINNQYECVIPSVLNTNAQAWKGFMIYGPQLCNDKPCEGGSAPRYYITYPLVDGKMLVISTIDTRNTVVNILIERLFASLVLK
ncbi:MAG: hypothetical protein WC004_04320 [Candidatus Absconditabacterales bacterium]